MEGDVRGSGHSICHKFVTCFSAGFRSRHGPLRNTCLAILILKRATPPIVGGKKTDLAVTGKDIFAPQKDRKKDGR